MLEDGSWQRPRRKKEEYVPIEEVSSEDLHPEYLESRGLLSPEEALIAKEEDEDAEERKQEAAFLDKRRQEEDEERYGWEEQQSRDEYLKALREAIDRFEQSQREHDEPPMRKEGIKIEGAMKPAQGHRGKEPRYKNKRRGPQIRSSR